MLDWWFRIAFWKRVAGGFVLGALAGWLLGPAAETWLQPLGTLYVNLIRMIAVPLVFFAVMNAVSALHGQQSMATLGGRTFGWFAVTATIAVGVALGAAFLFNPGVGVTLTAPVDYQPRDVPTPVQVLLDIVPTNPFAALAEGRILQVIFFAGLVGFALVKLGDRTEGLRRLIGQASDVMIQVLSLIHI